MLSSAISEYGREAQKARHPRKAKAGRCLHSYARQQLKLLVEKTPFRGDYLTAPTPGKMNMTATIVHWTVELFCEVDILVCCTNAASAVIMVIMGLCRL